MERVTTDKNRLRDTEEHESLSAVSALLPASPARRTAPQPSNYRTRIKALFDVMRPRQWTKNIFVFIGLVFSVQALHILPIERTLIAFLAFCAASSMIYIFNDIADLESDRQHPVKRSRPLPSGRLPVSWAVALAGVLFVVCCMLVSALFWLPMLSSLYADVGGGSLLFALALASYIAINVLYNLRLKHVVLVDVFCIAAGFVLRTIGGTVVIPVTTSPWLYLVICFLSLFMALGKRRHELVLLQGNASNHRKILKEYTITMLDQMMMVVVSCTLMAYSLYTIQGQTGHQRLIVTIPFVLYGMFRYLYLVYVRMEGGSPDEILLRDKHILGSVLLCAIVVFVVLYVLPPR